MAEFDFAHVQGPQDEPEVKVWSASKTLLLSVTVVAVVLSTFVGGFWLGRDQGIEVAAGEDKARLEKLLKQQENELEVLRSEAKKQLQPKVSTTQVGELTFYNELPKQNVNPAPLAGIDNRELKGMVHHAQKSSAKSKHAVAAHYMLQIASFQAKSDAKDFMPKLRKHGFSAVIKRVNLPRLGLWYRIYIEGFNSRHAAERMRDNVKQKLHITAVVIKRD